jgi:[ribosomal protein S5]-alanine N-acetyltransferase
LSGGRRILETTRLFLRELTPDDAQVCYDLNSDPEVIRYTGDSSFADVAEAHRFLSNYDQYRKYGIGRWGVIVKSTGKFIGWCGLKYSADVDEYDIGFRFFRDQWNKGYATESASACIRYGFDTLRLTMIVGRAMKVNTPSINVLKKIGLTYWKDDACGNADGVIYRIEKDPSPEESIDC